MNQSLQYIQLESEKNPEFAVIWMHGLGADGFDFVPLVKELQSFGLPPIRFIFPHAPHRAVTINQGHPMPAWYDITESLLEGRQEDETGLRESEVQIRALIKAQRLAGIDSRRIALAGFSQGGAMTYQVGLRHTETLAGLIVLSAYLPLSGSIETERHAANQTTPIFAAHGTQDPVVPLQRGTDAAATLQRLCYDVQWHQYPMQHSVCADEISDIADFLRGIFVLDDKA
jgi:phospholipase/carboxylesterase